MRSASFEERDGKTLLVLSELYPTTEALDAAGTGAQDVMQETFGQLDELLADLVAPPALERQMTTTDSPEIR